MGDVVVLKSGGPKMTVTSPPTEYPPMSYFAATAVTTLPPASQKMVTCTWFHYYGNDQYGEVHTGSFEISTLLKVEA